MQQSPWRPGLRHLPRFAPGRTPSHDAGLYEAKSVQASYIHAWFASDPVAAAALFLKDTHA